MNKVVYWQSEKESDLTFGDVDTLSNAFAEQQKTLDQMKSIAFYDKLTNLRNRQALEVDFRKTDIKTVSLLMIDVNGLKFMNDTYGHDKGDELIKTVASVLKNMFGDNAYRLGGDEYVVVISNEVSALQVASKLRAEISNQKISGVPDFKISVAIGAANGKECVNLSQLLKKSDTAMYQNKQAIKATEPQKFKTVNQSNIPSSADFIIEAKTTPSKIGYIDLEKDDYAVDYKLAKKKLKRTLIRNVIFTVVLVVIYFLI